MDDFDFYNERIAHDNKLIDTYLPSLEMDLNGTQIEELYLEYDGDFFTRERDEDDEENSEIWLSDFLEIENKEIKNKLLEYISSAKCNEKITLTYEVRDVVTSKEDAKLKIEKYLLKFGSEARISTSGTNVFSRRDDNWISYFTGERESIDYIIEKISEGYISYLITESLPIADSWIQKKMNEIRELSSPIEIYKNLDLIEYLMKKNEVEMAPILFSFLSKTLNHEDVYLQSIVPKLANEFDSDYQKVL